MTTKKSKLLEGIEFFERMVQTMPGDRISLEFLAVAYEKTGDDKKRQPILIQLADTLIRENEYDSAERIIERIEQYDNPEAKAAVARLRAHIHPAENNADNSPDTVATPATDDVHAISHAAAAAEMELIWKWKDRKIVSEEQCMAIMHVLSERPITNQPLLVSALATLNDLQPTLTDNVLGKMADMAECPPIPLEAFEMTPNLLALFSPAFRQINGFVPFAQLEDTLLVAVLNPFNKTLLKTIEKQAGMPCIFYMAHPQSMVHILDSLAIAAQQKN